MNQDMVRKQKKYRRTWISFAVILFLLLLVFFSAINTGSLSVSFGQLLRGLFVEYDENVAAVYDLRFPCLPGRRSQCPVCFFRRF